MKRCARCQDEVTLDRVVRSSTCRGCGAYLHSCVNCRFYSPGRHNDCSEPQAELVSDKTGANFCDFFVMADRDSPGRERGSEARKRFDELFGI
jgi:hypothetical protein